MMDVYFRKFSGVVTLGDECRVSEGHEHGAPNGAIWIGEDEVIGELDTDSRITGVVTIGLLNQKFDGALFIEMGWGYSEWTPMDSDMFRVGDHDLIDILQREEGNDVTLIVSTGPIDLADAVPEQFKSR